jgi:hypothetical protein
VHTATTIVLLVHAVVLAAPAAGAPSDGKDSARESARRAGVAYNLGHYDEAADLYETAYRLVQDPTLLFNIGQAYRMAGKPDRALAAYKGFLRTAQPGDANRATVEARAAEMEKAVEEARRPALREPPARPAPAAPAPAPAPATVPVAARAPTPASPPAATSPEVAAAPAPEAESGFKTTAGGHVGTARSDGESTMFYQVQARVADPARRIYEVGYFSRPIYPMVAFAQLSAVYAAFTTTDASRWEVGAFGREGGVHFGYSKDLGVVGLGLRFERAHPEVLCADPDGTINYLVPEARLKVPAHPKFTVLGYAAYRGKLSHSSCGFHPSQLTIDLSGDLTLSTIWLLRGGIGHYAVHDYGPGNPRTGWDSRPSSVEQVHLGPRATLGRIAFFGEAQITSYAGGAFLLLAGAEFRSSAAAP